MSSHFRRVAFALALVLCALVGVWSLVHAGHNSQTASVDPVILKSYQWRSIGPQRGGRSIAASGVKGRPKEAYFGAVGGGLWKTIDGGAQWAPVTDGQLHSSSVGAVAVSESNPETVFIGMGEACIRGNIMPGDGVYKSTDAGKTWTHVGFAESQAISKIRIHPTNADVVFVASFGKYSAPSEERGVFKSTDGGKTWKRTLFRDNKTGAVDLAIDHNNPNVVYAALWEAYRLEYQMSSGGPGCGLFKSTDSGETWSEITRNPGLPSGVVGRIGIAVSGADSNRVYALVENENGGLFSSDDAGATWKLINSNRSIRQRAFYYTHVTADTKNKDTVYLLNTSIFRSTDGGKTLTSIGTGTHGDHHDLWVDPDNAQHLVLGNDGGGAVSQEGGKGWSGQALPTGQFYHVITTKHVPYHVCGAQQDSTTLCVPSNTNQGGGRGGGGIAAPPPTYSAGGGEPGYIAPDPKDPDVFFAGGNNGTFITRLNRKTGELREVGPYPRLFSGEPASALVERIQWTFPIIFSPLDPNVLYTATQHVWKTTNGGQSWQKISRDLTRHDPKTMGESGGPITHDMNSPEVYATVFALGPGKTDVNVIWAGSDDGLIHVTRDGGKTWTNVTPKDMPEFGRVSLIDASAFDAGTAYVAVKKPLLNDFTPYLFRTHDFGKTWTKITNGIGALDYVHAVREDPTRKGLLYAGTQHGIYVSFNDGDAWESLSLNLPDTQVCDIIVEKNDLVITTHGRGFYILDHLGPLREHDAGTADAHLFKTEDGVRSAGGARIAYLLKKPVQKLTIEILDGKGKALRTFTATPPPAQGEGGRRGAGGEEGEGGGGGRFGGQINPPMTAGLHNITWDLRDASATAFPGMVLWGGGVAGPAVLPGNYQVRLTADGQTLTQSLSVKRHPLINVSDADLQEQFALASQIRDKLSEANNAVIQMRKLKEQVAERIKKSNDNAQLKAAGATLSQNLSAVEAEIYQVRNQSNQDPLNFPIKINNRLAALLSMVNRGDGKPIGNALPVFNDLKAELKVQTDRLTKVSSTYLAAFNAEAKRLGLEVVSEK